jgi:hypothetical protein
VRKNWPKKFIEKEDIVMFVLENGKRTIILTVWPYSLVLWRCHILLLKDRPRFGYIVMCLDMVFVGNIFHTTTLVEFSDAKFLLIKL